MMKRALAVLLMICLLLAASAGAEPSEGAVALRDQGIELPGGSVHYLKVTGMEDASVEEAVNAQLTGCADIPALVGQLALLGSSPVKLKVNYTVTMPDVPGGILCAVYEMSGPLEDTRATHAWAAVTVDLLSGESVGLDRLFADPEAALETIGTYMEEEVAPDISDYLAFDDLLPLPQTFSIDQAGITWYYPIRQLATLSDRAGAVQIAWYELESLLRLENDDILTRMGVRDALQGIDPEAAAQCVASGKLPGIPAVLGAGMKELIQTNGLRCDADYITGARSFELEPASFRNVYILTDALSEKWDDSLVQGIRSDRMNLAGLKTNITERSEWLNAFGEPEASLTLDQDQAEGLRMVPGTSDYYTLGGHRLRLHADEAGILRSILILP